MKYAEQFRIGEWLVRPDIRTIIGPEGRVQLEPRVMGTLVHLAENEGRPVSRRELIDTVWSDVVVTEGALTRAISELRHALGDNPRQPSYIDTVYRLGYRLIAPVIPSTEEKRESAAIQVTRRPKLLTRRRRRQWCLGIAAAVACAVVLWSWVGVDLARHRPSNAGQRPSVAVIGFLNLSAEEELGWVSTALSEMVTAQLAADNRAYAVGGDQVAQLRLELSLPEVSALSAESLMRIAACLGVDRLGIGSYFARPPESGGIVQVNLRIEDVLGQAEPVAFSVGGTLDELPEVASQIAIRVRQELGLGALSEAEARCARACVPQTREAARLYAFGLDRLRTLDPRAACDLLSGALALEPGASRVHAACAAAWSALGRDAEAAEAARRAFELSADLWLDERLLAEGRCDAATAQWEHAITIYRELAQEAPQSLENGLRLARVELAAALAQDALNTVEGLRQLPPPAGADPRIDLEEARAATMLAQLRRARTAATRAAAGAKALGACRLEANALLGKAEAALALAEAELAAEAAHEALLLFEELKEPSSCAEAHMVLAGVDEIRGRPDDAEASLNHALTLHRQIGEQPGLVEVLGRYARFLGVRGEGDRAVSFAEEALSIARTIGHQRGLVQALDTMAWLQSVHVGDLDAALEIAQEAVAVARTIGDDSQVSRCLEALADVMVARGDTDGALTACRESSEAARRVGNLRSLVDVLVSTAAVERSRGELIQARAALDECEATLGQIEYPTGRARELSELATLRLCLNEITSARDALEEALALSMKSGDREGTARAKIGLAMALLELGQRERAEDLARQALEELVAIKHAEGEAIAASALAAVAYDAGRVSEAFALVTRAQKLASRLGNRGANLQMTLAAARISAAAGKLNGATDLAESALALAVGRDLVEDQLEARFVLAEIDVAAGRVDRACTRLVAVVQDAGALGFLRTAARAQSLLAQLDS